MPAPPEFHAKTVMGLSPAVREMSAVQAPTGPVAVPVWPVAAFDQLTSVALPAELPCRVTMLLGELNGLVLGVVTWTVGAGGSTVRVMPTVWGLLDAPGASTSSRPL